MKISIKNKILISFLILNVFVFSLLIILFVSFFRENNRNFIEYDLQKVQQDVVSYIDEFIDENNIGFVNTISEKRSDLLEYLNAKLKVRGAIYGLDRKIIGGSDTDIEVFQTDDSDLTNALGKKASYTVFEKEHLVCFSVPLIVSGEMLGIYRLEKDYSRIFNASSYFSRIILIFGGLSLLFVFIISLIISRSISRPILSLQAATEKIASKEYSVNIDIKSKDEIGDLANNFKIMQDNVREHFLTIQKDKELLAELLEQRKSFFDNVTHELKTPLTVIQAYTQMIVHNGLDDEEFINKGMTHILEESIRLHKLVLSLLELSENNTHYKINFEAFDISTLLEGICESISIKATDNEMTIIKNIEPSLEITGVKDEIKGLFINLMDNAVKYAGKNSIIKVLASDKSESVDVTISDNGKGISRDKLDKIFEPFYRIDRKKSREIGSSGLGLSIVKKIVDNHKGTITVESDLNAGTTFTVTLPKNPTISN